MDYLRINRITEQDFDSIIKMSGGEKIDPNRSGSSVEHADYILNESIIELKFICEEGLEKQERQKKVASIFSKYEPDKPVVVLDPDILSFEDLKRYNNLMEQPIKRATKKAAKQLKSSASTIGASRIKVLVIINDGYTSLEHHEFKAAVGRRIRNDTRNVDHAVVGGVYYYSDRCDNYFFAPFDLLSITLDKSFDSFVILRENWNKWLEEYMKGIILEEQLNDSRLPVVDLNFNIDGTEYVKVCPSIGKPSSFWPDGKRQRENSTGIETCPAVATCFPKLSKDNWKKFKTLLHDEINFQKSYSAWLKWSKEQESLYENGVQPFVSLEADYDDFMEWQKEPLQNLSFSSLCWYVTELFQTKTRLIMDNAIDKDAFKIIVSDYILLRTEEIGQDKAFDLSSIYHVNELPGLEEKTAIIENKRIFFEHALALAAAYTVKQGVEVLIYERDKTYIWS